MENNRRKNYIICFSLIGAVLIIDQALKIWVKTHLAIGDGFNLIGEWSKIYFVENEGIAFGISFGSNVGKLILSLFRMIASVGILIYLINRIKKGARNLFLVSISLIFVGAVGNLLDSCFYGLIFNASTPDQVATLFPEDGGYGRFLYGRVVDMFYFPIAEWTWPAWMPWFGGKDAEFFNAIFNVADAAVCVGVALLIIDQFKNDSESKGESIDNKDVVDDVSKNGGETAQITE